MARKIQQQLIAENAERRKGLDLITQFNKAQAELLGIGEKIIGNQEQTLRLNEKQLEKQVGIAERALANVQAKADQLVNEKKIVNLTEQELKNREDLSDEERSILLAKINNFETEKKLVIESKKELEIRKKVNKETGITGKIVKGFKKLGFDFSEALAAAEEESERIQRSGSDIEKAFSQTLVNVKLLQGGLTVALDTFVDFANIGDKLVNNFFAYNKSLRETRQLTGQSATNFSSFNDSLVTSVDQIETITALSKELGINVNAAFSQETILQATELTKLLGISEQTAAKLAVQAEAFGFNLEEVEDSAFETVRALGASGKAAINVQQVLEDTGQVSGRLQVTLGKNPKALVDAAAAARQLGLSLSEVENVADGLLDFESSIRAELEAELLTGQQINLDRARGLALMNDMEGLSSEIANNQDILNAFQNDNRLAQKAIEESLGLSSDQIAKIIFQQKINEGLTAEQAGQLAGINEDEAKRLGLQEQLDKSIAKIAQSLAPVAEAFASILSNSFALYGILGLIATLKFAGLISQLITIGLLNKKNALTGVAAKIAQGGPLALAGTIAAVAAGIAATTAIIGSIDDGMIDSKGGLVVSGPKGSFALNSQDTIVANKNGVIAGTNLGRNSGGGGSSNAALLSRVDKLIAATERGSQINMDGNLVGKSVANNTSRIGL
tara:strand:- start:369 stop:2390 length:2022 start_codon:yes stop_codon:yes gene_type:complete